MNNSKTLDRVSSIVFLILCGILLNACTKQQDLRHNNLTMSLQKYGDVEKSARQSLQKAREKEELNAIISMDEQAVITQARASDKRRKNNQTKGILDGVLLVVKDNIHVANMPNTAGTPGLKNFVPKQDAPVIQRLKNEGAIIFAKTNMHELAFGISSYNPAFSKQQIGVRNAHNTERMAGGSSGGTAVAIAAGIVQAGLGTDTGGSSRIPAALNGIVGFRPTIGRYSQEGITPISHTRDTVGPMANNVASVILLDAVMSGDDSALHSVPKKQWRLGIAQSFLQNIEPEVDILWQKAINKFAQSGITLVEVEADNIFKLNALVGFPVALYEAGMGMRDYLKKYHIGKTIDQLSKDIVSPDVAGTYKGLVIPGKLPTPNGLVAGEPIYNEAIKTHRPALIKAYQQLFAKNKLDALVFPTTPAVAKKANAEASSLENFVLFIQNTDPGSNAGIPGLSLPMGITTHGLPAGIEIDGPSNSDATLLTLGSVLEKILAE